MEIVFPPVGLHGKREDSGSPEGTLPGPGLVTQSRTPEKVCEQVPGEKVVEKQWDAFDRKWAEAEAGGQKRGWLTNRKWSRLPESVGARRTSEEGESKI